MTEAEKLLKQILAIFDESGTHAAEFHGRFSIEVEPKIRRLLEKKPPG